MLPLKTLRTPVMAKDTVQRPAATAQTQSRRQRALVRLAGRMEPIILSQMASVAAAPGTAEARKAKGQGSPTDAVLALDQALVAAREQGRSRESRFKAAR